MTLLMIKSLQQICYYKPEEELLTLDCKEAQCLSDFKCNVVQKDEKDSKLKCEQNCKINGIQLECIEIKDYKHYLLVGDSIGVPIKHKGQQYICPSEYNNQTAQNQFIQFNEITGETEFMDINNKEHQLKIKKMLGYGCEHQNNELYVDEL